MNYIKAPLSLPASDRINTNERNSFPKQISHREALIALYKNKQVINLIYNVAKNTKKYIK